HERAGIGEHAYKAAKQATIGERVQLPLHRFFLIEEPPATAELDLARYALVLEIADHGCNDIVVSRVEVIENDFGQSVLVCEPAEICAESLGLWPVADRVKADIAT